MSDIKSMVFAATTVLLSAVSANAEVTFGLGSAAVPQFEGSADYSIKVAPFLSFKGEKISVRTNGPGIEIDLLSSRAFDAGPILRYKFGRDGSKIDNAQVAALPKINDGFELGGFAQLNFPVGGFSTFIAPRISVVQGVQGGAKGTLVEASVGITRLQGDWVFGARASTTYANADYMNTYFGVSGGSPSGLAAFNASAGIKDAGLSLFANYKISGNLSATAVLGYKTLMGDAANSPIVQVAGSSDQGFISLGLNYSFN